MKYIIGTLITFLVFSSCQTNDKQPSELIPQHPIDRIINLNFQSLIDSEKLTGTILIYHQNEDAYYSNDFDWANKGQLPASTFKIPNSIIALELGIIRDSTSVLPWNGEPQMNPNWEQDLKLKDALQLSCVPCYREIAKQIGLEKIKAYCHQFDYGRMVIDSSNLDLFWLMGKSKITPFEQIDFLSRFNTKQLAITDQTYTTMKYILLRENTEEYQLYGKTGWSNDNNHDNTWFVGFMEASDQILYFAANLEPTPESDINSLAMNRVLLTKKALESIVNVTFK